MKTAWQREIRRSEVRLDDLLGGRTLERGESLSTEWVKVGPLFLKRRKREPEKAEQEHRAVQVARNLLPPELAPARTLGVFRGWLVSENIQGPTLEDHPTLPDCQVAARYLARLHDQTLTDETKKKLRESQMTYYSGSDLRTRIEQEADKARLAFPGSVHAARLRNVVGEIILDVYDLDDPSVLGHGDFQANNIFVRGSKVLAVDWTDFGLCCRAYEVAHFVHSTLPDYRARTVDAYFAEVPSTLNREWLLLGGEVLDAIIRAGSVARRVCDLGTAVDDNIAREFQTQVDRARRAVEEFYRPN